MAPSSTIPTTVPGVADDKPREKSATERLEEAKSGKPAKSSGGGTTYLNTTSSPLVYDKRGHQVDAQSWTPEITLDEVGRAARHAGFLLPPSAL